MNCHCFEVVPHLSKSELKSRRTGISVDRCNHCSKQKGVDGVILKTCGKCKFPRYCSVECQREDWSFHKVDCSECPHRLFSIAKTLLASPLVLHNLAMCIIFEYNLHMDMSSAQQTALVRQPLVVKVDMSFEPSCLEDMALLCGVKEALDVTNIRAMLQINNVSRSGYGGSHGQNPAESSGGGTLTSGNATQLLPQDVLEHWEVLRRTVDNNGLYHCPVAIFTFALMHQCLHCAVPLPQQALDAATARPSYSTNLSTNGPALSHQPSSLVASQISHLNEHIRNDTENHLLLRRQLHQLDADLIIKASNKPSNAEISSGMAYEAGMLYYRLLREPVYQDLTDLST